MVLSTNPDIFKHFPAQITNNPQIEWKQQAHNLLQWCHLLWMQCENCIFVPNTKQYRIENKLSNLLFS